MKAKELRIEYAAQKTGEMPILTNYAKWLENKLTSLYSGGVSEAGIIHLLEQYKSTGHGTMSEHKAVHAIVDYANLHPTPEISEEEISEIIYNEFKHGKSGAFTVCADRAAESIVKWAISKEAKPISEERIKNCPICKTTSNVSLNETTIPEQYTCNSCEFTWDKLN